MRSFRRGRAIASPATIVRSLVNHIWQGHLGAMRIRRQFLDLESFSRTRGMRVIRGKANPSAMFQLIDIASCA